MMYKAWSSIEEVPYFFSRSYMKLQGHTAKEIVHFYPNWLFPDCNSSLNSLMVIGIDHLYSLRCRGWYCNPEQHELCRPSRGRRPYKWSISILPRSQFTKSKGNLRFRRLVPLFVPIGVCVMTHDDGTASDVTIGMWRHNQQATNHERNGKPWFSLPK